MRYLFLTATWFVAFPLIALAAGEPPVVPHVDLERYMGRWYEIASIPKFFSKGCTHTTATYRLRDDGTVSVRNVCLKDGEESSVHGKAWVVDPKTNAKLKVQFFWPFKGDYWIFDLDPDYRYALVGGPDRNSLWILSRTKQLPPETYEQILVKAKSIGFDTSRLKKTLQADE